jgi:sRNA-binding protein
MLGSITGSNVVAATGPAAEAISRRAAQRAQRQQQSAAYSEAEQAVAEAEAEAAAAEQDARRYATFQRSRRPAGGRDDVAARLDDLARLRDSGVLSAAEFEAAKAKLLGA